MEGQVPFLCHWEYQFILLLEQPWKNAIQISTHSPSLLFSLSALRLTAACFTPHPSYQPLKYWKNNFNTPKRILSPCLTEEVVAPLWAAWTSPHPQLRCLGFLCNRNMSIGTFSAWKEKPCLVVALSSDQSFFIFEDEEPYKPSQSKRAWMLQGSRKNAVQWYCLERLGNCRAGEPTFAELNCVASDWVS